MRFIYRGGMMIVFSCISFSYLHAQTDGDAIMMKKGLFCVGGMYSNSSWTDYWEGTFKRDNENLGVVSTQMIGAMGNYGLTDRVNLLFSLPYVKTKATQGTLSGLEGFQDLSLMVKWKALGKKIGTKDVLSVYGIGGLSFPVSDYVADFLPLSIGMRSRNLVARGMIDYQHGKFFTTASGMYMHRSNIRIDREAYYTTEMHYSHEVKMYDVAGFNVRMGYRSKALIAEAVLENMNTLGGFDIRKNDMPFPSNRMNATLAGVHFKYTMQKVRNLEILGGGRYTLAGRNVGQATLLYGGLFYIIDFSGKKRINSNLQTPKS